jgi:glucokinase
MALSGKSLSSVPTAATVAKSALEGDSICREAVMRFLAILGSFAGDCALLFSARGGVYFGGGVLPRLWPMVAESPLIERFNAKGRMTSWISKIPLRMINDDSAALRGAAIAVDRR